MRKPLSVLAALAVASVVLVAAPAYGASRYSVTVAVSAASADVGQSVTLTGKVKPAAAGERVKVQRLAGTTWTTVAKARLNRHSRYSVAVSVAAPGDNAFRVLKPKSDGHKAGVSPVVTVVGWRWRDLAGMPVYQQFAATVLPSGTLGTQSFAPFIKLGSPSSTGGAAAYILDGKCTRFDSHVGVTSDSASIDVQTAILARSTAAAPTTFEIVAEDHVLRDEDPVHVVRGPEVLTGAPALEVYANTSTTGTYVGWGAAMVYCRS